VASERDSTATLDDSVCHRRTVVRRHPATLPLPIGVLAEVQPSRNTHVALSPDARGAADIGRLALPRA
jgi:hypothetical protein